MPTVVRNIRRAEAGIAAACAGFGVATTHQAQRRTGLLARGASIPAWRSA